MLLYKGRSDMSFRAVNNVLDEKRGFVKSSVKSRACRVQLMDILRTSKARRTTSWSGRIFSDTRQENSKR